MAVGRMTNTQTSPVSMVSPLNRGYTCGSVLSISHHFVKLLRKKGIPILRQDDFQKSLLVLTGWRHGRVYGGHLASCMIISCLMNRVRLGWGTVLEVLDRIPNFAATTEMPTGTPSIWEPGFVRLLHEVEAIYDGTQDYSKGALYWCDTREVNTVFFKDKILGDHDTHKRVMEMNTLAFFI